MSNAYRIFWSEHDKDQYECPLCGRSQTEFHVHHRNGIPFDDRMENLVGLCSVCHRQLHHEEDIGRIKSVDDWKEAFNEVVLAE